MTPTKDDEREAREWLTNAANFGMVHEDDIKHRATLQARRCARFVTGRRSLRPLPRPGTTRGFR